MRPLQDRAESNSESDFDINDCDAEKSNGWNENTELDLYVKNKNVTNKIIKKANELVSLASVLHKYDIKWIEPSNPTGWRKAHCPFYGHFDSSPSFGFSATKGVFNCFGCGKSGCVVQFVAFMERRPFLEIAKEILCKFKSPDEIVADLDDDHTDKSDCLILEFSKEIREFLYRNIGNPKALEYVESLTWTLDVYLEKTAIRGTVSFESLFGRIEKLREYLRAFGRPE